MQESNLRFRIRNAVPCPLDESATHLLAAVRSFILMARVRSQTCLFAFRRRGSDSLGHTGKKHGGQPGNRTPTSRVQAACAPVITSRPQLAPQVRVERTLPVLQTGALPLELPGRKIKKPSG